MNEKKRYAGEMKISVSVKPNAKKDAIESMDGKQYAVRLRASPIEGKANDALIKLLAKHFDIAAGRIRIVSGASSSRKIIEIL